MTVFTFVRHGTPHYDLAEDRRLRGGVRDWVPLSPQGIAEAEQAAELLQERGADLILSSPMTRSLQTASIISRALDLPLMVEFDLHEWLPDMTQSYDSYEVVLAAVAEMERGGGEWPVGMPRQWEPLSQVRRRVAGVLRRYAHLEHVIVASHGMVIATLTGEKIPCGGVITYAPSAGAE